MRHELFEEMQNLKPYQGQAYCQYCKKNTQQRVSFDLIHKALISMCLTCFEITGKMNPEQFEKYVAQKKYDNRKIMVSILEEIKKPGSQEIKDFVDKINSNLG